MEQLDLFSGEVSSALSRGLTHYSPETLYTFLSTLDMVEVCLDVLGDRLQRRPISKNYVGVCPFHSERTPSFFVRPKYNTCRCFGCGIEMGPLRFSLGVATEGIRVYGATQQSIYFDYPLSTPLEILFTNPSFHRQRIVVPFLDDIVALSGLHSVMDLDYDISGRSMKETSNPYLGVVKQCLIEEDELRQRESM